MDGCNLDRWKVQVWWITLLNNEWVLTAAHCVTDALNAVKNKNRFQISLGQYDITKNDSNVQFYKVAEIIKHPLFNYTTYNADLALMQLRTRCKFTDFIRPVCLTSKTRHKKLFKYRSVAIAQRSWMGGNCISSEICKT